MINLKRKLKYINKKNHTIFIFKIKIFYIINKNNYVDKFRNNEYNISDCMCTSCDFGTTVCNYLFVKISKIYNVL